MSVFYFHVRNGKVLYLDREGVECADIKVAWDHALKDARVLFRARETTERWIEVEDSRGAIVATPPEGATYH